MAAAADPQGNLYVSGAFSGVAKFSAPLTTLTSAGDADAYLIKYDGQGNILWSLRLGGTGYDTANGVAVDATTGFVYLAGRYAGPVTMGPTTLTNIAAGFLAKIDPAAGTVIWAKDAGLEWFGLTLDGNSNAYVVGQPQSLQLVGGKLAGPIALAKYSSDGTRQWYTNSLAAGFTTIGSGRAIAVDADANVYITGIFRNVVQFGSTSLSNAPAPNNSYDELFVAKFSSAGIPQWAKRGGAAVANDQGLAIGVDANANLIVAGVTDNTSATVDLGGFSFPAPVSGGSASLTLGKFNSSGVGQWARKIDGVSKGAGISVAASGSFIVTGYFRPIPCDFGGVSLTKDWVNEEVYVVNYDFSGTALWGRRTSSTLAGVRAGVAVVTAPNGPIYAVGTYTGVAPTDFDGTSLASVSTRTSAYVARLGQTSASAPQISGLTLLGNGVVRLSISGTPGQSYIIQASGDLSSWTPASTNIPNNGVIEFTDPSAIGSAPRFYRLRLP